jgi:hypothetical protein
VKAWGDAVKSMAEGLGSALSLLNGIRSYRPVGEAALTLFMSDVQALVQMFVDWIVTRFEGITTPAAVTAWGIAVKALADGLGSALTLLNGLRGYIPAAQGVIRAFMQDVATIIREFITWIMGPFAALDLDAVTKFGNALKALGDGLKAQLDLLVALKTYIGPAHDTIDLFMQDVAAIITSFKIWVLTTLTDDERDAVLAFSGVLDALVGSLRDTLSFLQDLATLPEMDVFDRKLQAFNTEIVRLINGFYTDVVLVVQPAEVIAVDQFVAMLEHMTEGLGGALDLLVAINGADLPTTEKLREYLGLILELFQSLATGLASVPSAVTTAAGLVRSAVLSGLSVLGGVTGFYAVGAGYGASMAQGIRDSIPAITAALGAVRGMIPSSPAESGPFQTLPNADWVGDWMGDIQGAMTAGIQALNAQPLFAPAPFTPVMATPGGGVTVNITGQWNVRNDQDVTRIGAEVYREFERKAGGRW